MADKERYLTYLDALAALASGDSPVSHVAAVEQELLNGIFLLRKNGNV